MTTVDKAHALWESFQGRSPAQVYVDACKKHGAKVNTSIKNQFSTEVNDYDNLEDLSFHGNYVGARGSMGLLELIQCHPKLWRVDLSGIGIDDAVVHELVEVLQDHPRMRVVTIADNPDVSVHSAKRLCMLVRQNVNIIELRANGTHIGDNVVGIIDKMCTKNLDTMNNYYTNDYFRMKNVFMSLDVDGSGWVSPMTVGMNIIYPMVQEKFLARLKSLVVQKRHDGYVDVNNFMVLTYIGWRSLEDVHEHAQDGNTDTVEEVIKSNWEQLNKALKDANCSCTDLSRIRMRSRKLDEKNASEIVNRAQQMAKEEGSSDGTQVLPQQLHKAAKEYGDKADDSRAKRRASFLDNEVHTEWSVPVNMMRRIVKVFDGCGERGMLVDDLLTRGKEELVTDIESIDVKLLKSMFVRAAIPVKECYITLQETANLFDEQYHTLSIARKVEVSKSAE